MMNPSTDTAIPPDAGEVREACITLIAAAHEKPRSRVTDHEVMIFWVALNHRRTLREAVGG